jgi:hypothetical protein
VSPVRHDLSGLPGAELIAEGLDDLAAGAETAAALLVAIGAPRLRRLRLPLPASEDLPRDPDLRLYHRLGREHPADAHGRYRALLRRLVSFESALEHAQERRRRG